jgi:SAM-dependent methyltransferase
MPNKWIEHIRKFSRENNISYGCSISDPRCKSSYKPKTMHGIELSQGFAVLKSKTEVFSLKIKVDIAVSLGVIHHIPDPVPAVVNIRSNLKDGGLLTIWVYGYENNEIYVRLQKVLRPILRAFPGATLNVISLGMKYLLDLYLWVSNSLFKSQFTMNVYESKLFSKSGRMQKKYIVFDQLNPMYAKYYTESEISRLTEQTVFKVIEVFPRHNYSWTVISENPTFEVLA